MYAEQTVDIPASHRLTIDVPREVPAGRATILIFRPTEEADGGNAVLPMYTSEAAIQKAAELRADPNRKPISRYFGILSPATYGDGVAYQRKLRDEWDV